MHSPDPPPRPIPSALMALLHGLVFLLTVLLRGLYLVGITFVSALIYIRRAIVTFEADPSFWIALSDLRRGASDTVGSLGAVGRSFIDSFREAPNGSFYLIHCTKNNLTSPPRPNFYIHFEAFRYTYPCCRRRGCNAESANWMHL